MDELNIPGVDELLALNDDIDVGRALPALAVLLRNVHIALADGKLGFFEVLRLGKDLVHLVNVFKRKKN